jgi:hypothetical protein
MLPPAEFRSVRVMRPRIGPLFALALLGPVVPAPAADMRVTPARQAERDGLRRQILAQELASEQQALAGAEQRLAERTAAKDPQGAQEAEDARRVHARNLDTLRAEIARTAPPLMRAAMSQSVPATAGTETKLFLSTAGPDAGRLHRVTHPNSAPTREATAAAAGVSPRWWDVYDDSAASPPHTTPHAWNVYHGGTRP